MGIAKKCSLDGRVGLGLKVFQKNARFDKKGVKKKWRESRYPQRNYAMISKLFIKLSIIKY